MKDIRSAIDIIRDASNVDLIIVSLFLLPFLLGSWSTVLNAIPFLDQHNGWKFAWLVIVAIAYCVGLILMKMYDPIDEQLKRAAIHVQNFLSRKSKWGYRSFMAIREYVNENYTDEFLLNLIDKNPATFRRVKVKRSGKAVEGIGLVKEELDD